MDNTVTYREAQPEDVAVIYQMLYDMMVEEDVLSHFSKTQDSLHEALFGASPLAEALLAECGGEIAGFALFSETNRNFTFFDKPGIYLHDLYVAPNHRRNGVGTQMMQQLEDIAKQRGCGRLDWVVLSGNTRGQQFYQSIDRAAETAHIKGMRIRFD